MRQLTKQEQKQYDIADGWIEDEESKAGPSPALLWIFGSAGFSAASMFALVLLFAH